MPFATVGKDRIFYVCHRAPDPNAPVLVLVHGSGGNHQLWGDAVRRLRSANTYAVDLPGHGRSEGAGCTSVDDYADFVVGFMNAVELERAVIAGHSLGGAIAMALALDYPQAVAGLFLVGTGARLRVLPAILEGMLAEPERTIELICGYAYSPSAPRELVRQGQEQMLHVVPQVVHDDFAACNAFDVMDRLAQIRCPTMVICGTHDTLTPPKYARYLVDKIPGSELALIDGAGHMVMIEKPELVAQYMESALSRWKR
jgi:pimeloyl-ACP methyl ester carboxylesterase